MKWLKRFFTKNEAKTKTVPPIPSWETVVDMLYDKQLDCFCDEVIRVIYSTDKSMRYVICKDNKDIFCYTLERIYQFEDDEWQYTYTDDESLPGMWEAYPRSVTSSLFGNEDDLLKELKSEPEYKQYFIQ